MWPKRRTPCLTVQGIFWRCVSDCFSVPKTRSHIQGLCTDGYFTFAPSQLLWIILSSYNICGDCSHMGPTVRTQAHKGCPVGSTLWAQTYRSLPQACRPSMNQVSFLWILHTQSVLTVLHENNLDPKVKYKTAYMSPLF